MAYTPDKPKLAESSEQLRARIPGWGADLDPKDRPSVPREVFDPTRVPDGVGSRTRCVHSAVPLAVPGRDAGPAAAMPPGC